jgi:hypothetical protein
MLRDRKVGGTAIALVLALSACTNSTTSKTAEGELPAGPRCIEPEDGSGCLPLAPAKDRVDLRRPVFSRPTAITNALHPSSTLTQVIYGGQVDGKPFRTEFSRLSDRKTIVWEGQRIPVVSWQYLAFSDGRIHEVAVDWFAQDDRGSVWYFGEDVFNYADGAVADTDGTWLAGKDGPPGMIMPGGPQVGDVYRPENIPDSVFEEVTVKAVNRTVPGPSGRVAGAVVVSELHFDGKREEKIFAPGYGEFSTGSPAGDLEAVTLAVPTDARTGPPPAGLTALSTVVRAAYDATGRNDWAAAGAASNALTAQWRSFRAGGVPVLLGDQMTKDIDALAAGVAARDEKGAHRAALRVAQNLLDLRLRHEPLAAIERARADLWARQVLIDAAAGEAGAVLGDATAFKWTWNRIRATAPSTLVAKVDGPLRDLAAAAKQKDLDAAGRSATALSAALTTH